MTARTYPQPHEGITGTDRTGDDLLSLEDEAIPRRLMMIGLAYCLCQATLVGNPAPVVARMSKRINDPQPGDLVMERATPYRKHREDDQVKGFGILITHRDEWWQTDEDLAADIAKMRADGDVDEGYLASLESGEERSVDHAWYIQYGPRAGDICRWTNCEFVTIPTDGEIFSVAAGTRDGNAVVFTRNDIAGALADSGFHLRT